MSYSHWGFCSGSAICLFLIGIGIYFVHFIIHMTLD